MNNKKVNFQVPNYIYQIITEDQKRFCVNNNFLCNTIFKMLKLNQTKHNIILGLQQRIQFNFHQSNQEDFEGLIGNEISNDTSKSEYFRDIFATYCSYPTQLREQIIFNDIYKELKEILDKKIAIRIKYRPNSSYQKIEPYFLAVDSGSSLNYLCGWSEKHKSIVNYRIAFIQKIFPIEKEPINKNYNKEEIEAIRRNFDPFLSYGHKIVAKLTPNGEKLLNKFIHNRPKILNKNGNIYTFEASELKGKLFFSGFWEDIEILEPKSLRKWFIERALKTIQNYKD